MRKTVFLSSTGNDLSDWRTQVIADARGYDLFRLNAMEEWGARSKPPLELCRNRVSDADILVGLIGHYRGWEPPGDAKQRSITEMEYDWAVEGNKARLMFVAPEGFAGATPASTGAEGDRQKAFRARLMRAETVDHRCFGSAHALSAAVFRSINNHLYEALQSQDEDKLVLSTSRSVSTANIAPPLMLNVNIQGMLDRGLAVEQIETTLKEMAIKSEADALRMEESALRARKDGAAAWKQIGSLFTDRDIEKAISAYVKAADLVVRVIQTEDKGA
jgi:hypothetical protein